MKAIAKRLERSRVLLALAGLSATAIVALGDTAQIMREVTGSQELGANGGKMDDKVGDLWQTAGRLSDWALVISVIAAPVALGGCALAMQFGGGKRAVGPAYAAVGAVLVSVLAKAMAA